MAQKLIVKKKNIYKVTPKQSHEKKYAEVPVKRIVEPRPVCKICSEPIEFIIDAICENNGNYSHFDCVIEKIKQNYELKENETVSYIGKGRFGIFYKDDKGHYCCRQTIEYENPQNYDSMKKFVEDSKQ